jgi:N-acyl-D-amino-acid deacylase
MEGSMKKNNRVPFVLKVALLCVAIILSGGGWIAAGTQADLPDYDILIKNARIFDGSVKEPLKGSVAISGDKIVKISRTIKGTAAKTIDAKGLYLSPGFIDMHSHADRGMYFPENRLAMNYLTQGVTSLVLGQCGGSAWPIFEKGEDQITRWTNEGIGPNVAMLVGHGQVRQLVMGMDNRAPEPEELDQMAELIREAMEQGASGISTGLVYRPGIYSETPEVIRLVSEVAAYGGIYHTHIRDERGKLLESISEAIHISEETGEPVNISHFKVMGKSNWGMVKEACRLIEEARARGVKVTADQYPFRFANLTPYRSLVPAGVWGRGEERLGEDDVTQIFDYLRDKELLDLYRKVTPYFPISDSHQAFLDSLPRKRLVQFVGDNLLTASYFRGPDNARERMLFLRRLQDDEQGEKIKKDIESAIQKSNGPENLIVGMCVDKSLEGKTLDQVAALRGITIAEAAIELDLMGAKCIPLQMCEEDIEYIMKKDYVTTGSDGAVPYFGMGTPHIRSYVTFLYKLQNYGIKRKTAGLPHIIRSQTSLPAEIMGWKDRGWVREGYKADLILLDLDGIKLESNITTPHAYCKGVEYLLVNGQLVIEKGKSNGKLPGIIISP